MLEVLTATDRFTGCGALAMPRYLEAPDPLSAVILDLENDAARRGHDSHREYCSLYVQLSRLRTFQGLHLLQKVKIEDLRFSPDPDLIIEMERLRDLEVKTLEA